MRWYILRNRRHEGPFSENELRDQIVRGQFLISDYLLSEEDLEKGRVNYRVAGELLNLDTPSTSDSKAEAIDSPKKNSEISEPNARRLVESLEAADFVQAQDHVRHEQQRIGPGRVAEKNQVLHVERSLPRKSYFRFQQVPTFTIVLFMTLGIVALSYFLAPQPASREGLIIVDDKKESAHHGHDHGGKNKIKSQPAPKAKRAPASASTDSRLQPTEREFFEERREDLREEPELVQDRDEDYERIDDGGEINSIRRKRSARRKSRNAEAAGLDGDPYNESRRPTAFDDTGEDDFLEEEEASEENLDDEYDEGDPENPRFVE